MDDREEKQVGFSIQSDENSHSNDGASDDSDSRLSKAEKLTLLRNFQCSRIEAIHKFFKEFDASVQNISIAKVKRTALEKRYEDFQQCQNELLLLFPQEYHDNLVETSDQYDELYYEAVAIFNSTIANEPEIRPVTQITTFAPMAKLPDITIPDFYGNDEAEFASWSESFEALVIKHQGISGIQKFHYLKGSCKGFEPRQIISRFEFTSAGFELAWDALKKRYKNKRRIIHTHISRIFNLKPFGQHKYKEFRNFLNILNANFEALKIWKQPVYNWDQLLIHLILTKLPDGLKNQWELQLDCGNDELPTLWNLFNFLEKRCAAMENIEKAKTDVNAQDQHRVQTDNSKRGISHVSTIRSSSSCLLCPGKDHSLFACDQFKSMPVNDRRQKVQELKLCFNCLRPGHLSKDCKSFSSCRTCSRKHNTLLHSDAKTDKRNETSNVEKVQGSSKKEVKIAVQNEAGTTGQSEVIKSFFVVADVVLATVVIKVKDNNGDWQICRALLDGGSQPNFMTEHMAQLLRLQRSKTYVPIQGVNEMEMKSTAFVSTSIKSRKTDYQKHLSFLVIKSISSNIPTQRVNYPRECFPDVFLADPDFDKPAKVDMLIGAETFYEAFWDKIKICDSLYLINTEFGYAVSGKAPEAIVGHTIEKKCLFTLPKDFEYKNELENDDTQVNLEKFWKLEEVHNNENSHFKWSYEEKQCEEHFKKTISRDDTGRFIASLPLKKPRSVLGDSKEIADRRLKAVERKFQSNEDVWNMYSKAMAENVNQNYMELITDEEESRIKHPYYHPHHGILKMDSITTKLRIVFDSSCKTSTGISLNNILMIGPKIQDDLFQRLVRFRMHRYSVTADIKQMYPQIRITPEDTNLQLIRWRWSKNEPIQTYRFVRIMFGLASAPFIAQRCLKQLAIEEGEKFPLAVPIMNKDFYMDDLLTGSNNINDLIECTKQVQNMLQTACMDLRKFCSNSQEVLNGISSEQTDDVENLKLDMDETIKALGLYWFPRMDHLEYKINLPKDINEFKYTKRKILSMTAQIFDPIGLLAPVIILAKMLNQSLWSEKLDWDQAVSAATQRQWISFLNELFELQHLKVNRFIYCPDFVNTELHGFGDASEKAYGACIYARSEDHQGNVQINLICAKSKVAPLKKTTLARLELCASLLLANLMECVQKELQIPCSNVYCWSDSTIALCWISNESSKWSTFVANRVSEIQRITEGCSWRHVSGKDNPADYISRGMTVQELILSQLWWHGPVWLQNKRTEWPVSKIEIDMNEIPERKMISMATVQKIESVFIRNSSFKNLRMGFARFYRFYKNFKKKKDGEDLIIGNITTEELYQAEVMLVRLEQRHMFENEFTQLKKIANVQTDKEEVTFKNQVHKSSSIYKLFPFLDTTNMVIRVGGRLANTDIETDKKFPMVLPSRSNLARLIAKYEHLRNGHIGAQGLLYTMRQKYWPIYGRSLCKHVVWNCIKCFKVKPKAMEYIMGNLPKSRVEPARPFLNVGLDYAGPFNVRTSQAKKSSHMKAWICIFVCFATKAIHIELVSDLTTECFLAAMRRFIGRRGYCRKIYSDNATTFVGASRELKEFHNFLIKQTEDEKTCRYLQEHMIDWNFIPAYAAHFGGLWEASVKSIKYHLKRVMTDMILTYEELYTLLVDIEAIVNSRPICQLSEDATDPIALSPAHFLIGESLTTIIEPDLCSKKMFLITRWKRLVKLKQHFWKRWSDEYLSNLHNRNKWLKEGKTVKIGDLVMIRDDKMSPMKWQQGIVAELQPGRDGRTRVVLVRTNRGVIKRAITHICPIPCQEDC